MKATIVNTVENTVKTVELPETITTVSALKEYLGLEEIRLFEGATHTDLEDDTQALPELPAGKKDKGYVFFVSPERNKIKNGAYSRKMCYALIKQRQLGGKVKEEYGRNFTQVSTDGLNSLLATYEEELYSNSITTEKELLQKIIEALPEGDKKALLDGLEKVFPGPYSIQDLSNMRG